MGLFLYDVDPEDVGAVALAAMAWVMGIPFDRSEERKVRDLARQVEDVLRELTDESTGGPVTLADGWWKDPS